MRPLQAAGQQLGLRTPSPAAASLQPAGRVRHPPYPPQDSEDELDIEAELGIELAKSDDEGEESEEEEAAAGGEARREEPQRPGSAEAARQLQQQMSKKVRQGGCGWGRPRPRSPAQPA